MNYLDEFLRKYNCSALFLPSFVGIKQLQKQEHNLIDCFLKIESEKDYEENCIFILFNPKNKESFKTFLNELKTKNENFVEEIVIEDYNVLVFKIPKEFEEDYKKFLEGKYSKFSENAKSLFPKFVEIIKFNQKLGMHVKIEQISLPWMIINKDKSLKSYWKKRIGIELSEEDEVWEKPNLEKEILRI